MEEDIIDGIIYVELHETLGPHPLAWHPEELTDEKKMSISIKIVTLLSTDRGILPESLVIIPFPALNLKGIIKYFEREDKTRRGNVVQSAIVLVFKEIDDIIFYKYYKDLENLFNRAEKNILKLNHSPPDSSAFTEELIVLKHSVLSKLDEFYMKELRFGGVEEFPEADFAEKKEDFVFKIIIIGDQTVGKTSIVSRFANNVFNRQYLPTIGVNVCRKSMKENVLLMLWDIAGQEKFNRMRKVFYDGADAVIFVFDLTNPQSFENIEKWHQDILNMGDKRPPVSYLLGNKLDLEKTRKIKKENVKKLTERIELSYSEVSALSGRNIEQSFEEITKKLLERVQLV